MLDPKRQSEFFSAAVPIPIRTKDEVTVNKLMNRRTQTFSMRKASAASGNSFETGMGVGRGNSMYARNNSPSPNNLTVPRIVRIGREGVDNEVRVLQLIHLLVAESYS